MIRRRYLGALAALCLVAAACSGGSADPATTLAATTTPATTTTKAATTTTTSLPPGVDLILRGGPIVTMADPPLAEAVAVTGDSIVAVGTEAEVMALAGSATSVVDLGGRALYPGFIDAHSHWYVWGGAWVGLHGAPEVTQALFARGWTGTTEMALDPYWWDGVVAAAEVGEMGARVDGYMALNAPQGEEKYLEWFRGLGLTPGTMIGDHLRIVGVKLYVDEAWGSIDKYSQEELDAVVAEMHSAGWQIAAHVVDDDTMDQMLHALEAAIAADPRPHRHRIEHAVEVRDDQLERLVALGITASVQLGGIEAEFPFDPPFWEMIADTGLETVWRWRDMIEAGITLVGSVDVPPPGFVLGPTSKSPMRMVYGAVTGWSESGAEPWEGREAQLLTIEEAIRSLTATAAWITSDEGVRGSIQPGLLADLVVFSADPLGFGEDPEGLLGITTAATLLGGRLVWCGDGEEALCEGFGQPMPVRVLDESTLVPSPPG
ncbi:MAG: amidohydrolase family protein [Acidimicrobiia bacterium]|nr:MAG: amidohydrolase family protein [Acidimicrobiia bacterium]